MNLPEEKELREAEPSSIGNAPLETEEQMRARHRREAKDFVTKTTAMKKQATKGEKKKRKEINKQIETLEKELKLRQQDELNVCLIFLTFQWQISNTPLRILKSNSPRVATLDHRLLQGLIQQEKIVTMMTTNLARKNYSHK